MKNKKMETKKKMLVRFTGCDKPYLGMTAYRMFKIKAKISDLYNSCTKWTFYEETKDIG